MKEVFKIYDKDDNGKITAKELKEVMCALNQHPDDDCVNNYIAEGDKDGVYVYIIKFICILYYMYIYIYRTL